MAQDKSNNPAEQTGEMRDLFRMLDQLEQQRNHIEQELRSLTSSTEEESAPVPTADMQMEMVQELSPVEAEDYPATEKSDSADWLPTEDLGLLLIRPYDEEEEAAVPAETEVESDVDDLPAPPAVRRNPFVVLWENFRLNLPAKGDSAGTLVRKIGFLVSLVVLLFSAGYLAMDMWVLPMQNQQLYQDLGNLYQPDNSEVVVDDTNYPYGMLASFKQLYKRNDEVRGWLSFHATGKKDFLNVEYPVMFSGDNDKYLTLDFDEKKNKNGALFFDERTQLETPTDRNKSLIIYGHNMASGQMLAGLNKFIGNVNNARSGASFTLSTLYDKNEYLVFAVILTDETESGNQWYFNTRRMVFSGGEDFLSYIGAMRARSLFDYPVEVRADDEIVVLSTCTGKSSAKVNDGRLVVVARRQRPGEMAPQTSLIVKNEDVIMPRTWYVNQKLELHPYYGGDYAGLDNPTTTTTGSTTIGSGSITTDDGSTSGSSGTGTTGGSTGTSGSSGTGTTGGSSGTSGSSGTRTTGGSGSTSGTTGSTDGTTGGDSSDSTTGSSTDGAGGESTNSSGDTSEDTTTSDQSGDSTTEGETTTTTESQSQPDDPQPIPEEGGEEAA